MLPLSRKRLLSRMIRVAAGLAATLNITPASAADRSASVQVHGQTRTYLIHVPDGAPPPGGFPLVLAFHGGGMQGAGMAKLTNLDAVADRRRFVAVYPNGIDKHWNDGRKTIRNPQDDVGFVSALIDQLTHGMPVDGRRIYATGLSNGALFAERLGCALSPRIAGIAPVAGSLPADMIAACRPARSVAVLQIDGTADPIMPYMGGSVADFGGRGEGGAVVSVADTAAHWAQGDGCGPREAPQPLPPTAPLDRTRIVRLRYAGCPAAGPVAILAVLGGGHAWPGGTQYLPAAIIGRASRQIDASEAIADFFLALPAR